MNTQNAKIESNQIWIKVKDSFGNPVETSQSAIIKYVTTERVHFQYGSYIDGVFTKGNMSNSMSIEVFTSKYSLVS